MAISFSSRCRRLLTLASTTVLLVVIVACGSTGAETPSEQTATPIESVGPQPTTAVTPSPTAPPRRTPDPEDSEPSLVVAITFAVVTEGSLVLEGGDEYTAEEIYFDSSNDGDETHNFTVVSWDGDPAGMPVDSSGRVIIAGNLTVDFGELGESDFAIYEVEPIAPGRYVMFCSLPGHYSDGEYAPFTIYAPPPGAVHHHLTQPF